MRLGDLLMPLRVAVTGPKFRRAPGQHQVMGSQGARAYGAAIEVLSQSDKEIENGYTAA